MGKRSIWIMLLSGLVLLICWGVFREDPSREGIREDYLTVTGPCHFDFPADHGAHPGYRTEWWYYTGNVVDESGKSFGFQLTFFRSQILTLKEIEHLPSPASNWRTAQLYFAHAAISNIDQKQFLQDEIMARGAMGLAGADLTDDTATIHIRDWTAVIRPESHQIQNRSQDFSFSLTLTPAKKAVAHGDQGYSPKGRSPERASCYYSFSRLQADGQIQIGTRNFAVKGSAWMDHEYSSAPLDETAVGWDWFSLQLDDQSELMLFWIREENGGFSTASGGTYIDPTGSSHHLGHKDIRLVVQDTWQSRRSGAIYPQRWRIRIPTLDCQLEIQTRLSDQEVDASRTTGIMYWEGSVSVAGRKKEQPVSGRGYAELTGYAAPFQSPL